MSIKEHLTVFVASSSDVQAERARVSQVIDRTNRMLGHFDLHLDVYRWEIDAVPGLHEDGPQALINPELDRADIVVLIVWNRVGKGTLEEFDRVRQRFKATGKPRLLPYFSRKPSVLDTEAECDARKAVIQLRDQIFNEGLANHYENVEDFERKVEEHLMTVAPQLKSPA